MPGKGRAALARIILVCIAILVALVLVNPPVAVWVGALLVTASVSLPLALNTDPEDLFDDGLEGGLALTWPILCLGLVVLAAGITIWIA